jgi:hypothetical protein
VLRYRCSHRLLRLFILFFFIALFGLMALVPIGDKHGPVLSVIVTFMFGAIAVLTVFHFVTLLLFREIRVYRDSIVGRRRWIGDREIKLTEASLIIADSRAFSARILCRQGTKWYLRGITGILYYPDLPDLKAIKKFNSLLAHMSGRRIGEFEQPVTIPLLIKEGETPRSAEDYAFDERLLIEDPGEKQFNRIANAGLVVLVLFVTLGMCVLWYAVLRRPF